MYRRSVGSIPSSGNIVGEMPNGFPKWLHKFTLLPAVYDNPDLEFSVFLFEPFWCVHNNITWRVFVFLHFSGYQLLMTNCFSYIYRSSSFVTCPFKSLAYFSTVLPSFSYGFVGVLISPGRNTSWVVFVANIFSPYVTLPFYSLNKIFFFNRILWWKKILNFNGDLLITLPLWLVLIVWCLKSLLSQGHEDFSLILTSKSCIVLSFTFAFI